MNRSRRLLAGAALGATLILLALALAHHLAVQRLGAAVRDALGPRATLGAVELGWTGVVLHDLHVAAGPGWPADEELHAGRVHVQPAWRSAWGGVWRIDRVEVDDARIVLLRTREGRLRVLPGLLERPAPPGDAAYGPAPASPALHIGTVALKQVQVDLHDASVRGKRPHHLRLADLDATLQGLQLPALDTPVQLQLQGLFRGPSRDGQLRIDGQLTPATRDADLRASLGGADLVALQPYLLRVADAGVRRGTLDVQVHAKVAAQRLHAPGRLVLTDVALASGTGLGDRFAGLSRDAVLAGLSRRGRIEITFTLDGRLDDPAFSINDDLATRFAAGLAESLGVSLSGVVDGVGEMVKGLFGR